MNAEDEAFIARTLAAIDSASTTARERALDAAMHSGQSQDADFGARVAATLDGAHLARRDAALERVFARDSSVQPTEVAAPIPLKSRPARARWLRPALLTLAAAAVASIVTGVVVSSIMTPSDEAPFAFGGDRIPTPSSEIRRAGEAVARREQPEIARDPQGRLASIGLTVAGKPDGERLLFRAGKLIRIEHWRDGQLDGTSIDFDGRGQLVRTRTFVAGQPRGPWASFKDDGTVQDSGSSEQD